MITIAIIGASGLVGFELLSLIFERNFKHDKLILFASENKEIHSKILEKFSMEKAVRQSQKAENRKRTNPSSMIKGRKGNGDKGILASR